MEETDYLRDSIRRTNILFHYYVGQTWKILLTIVTAACFLLGAAYGVGEHTPWWTHITYVFCHANIFHLLGNLLCLWRTKARLHLSEALIIAVAVTWLPLFTEGNVTMGLSGVLFAIFGIKWGQLHKPWEMLKYCGIIVAVTALIPNMSWAVHAYTLTAGFAYGWLLGYKHRDLRR